MTPSVGEETQRLLEEEEEEEEEEEDPRSSSEGLRCLRVVSRRLRRESSVKVACSSRPACKSAAIRAITALVGRGLLLANPFDGVLCCDFEDDEEFCS